jgi:hypothetical protein
LRDKIEELRNWGIGELRDDTINKIKKDRIPSIPQFPNS